MVRANQTSGNGQYRIVGDHLGSTSMIVDTSSPPSVVQRQYCKPFGESAFQYTAGSGSSLTTYGYTGQRLDGDNGLMYYGARYYDPALSYFISGDNIAPDPSDPKSRNRYSYALSNPIRYSDLTGQCADDDKMTCAQAKSTLAQYGFYVNLDEWDQVQDLRWMIGKPWS